ncbi:conserved hypothetical protein [Candidatus Zixiibacteriota bacterium]|nr:conserved hypothetical protein [candidate division Zixibacteria bacterium]
MKVDSLKISSHQREEFIDITSAIKKYAKDSGIENGLISIFVPHTTAADTINENADPDVTHDIIQKLNREFPKIDSYRHNEGNSDAHLKSSLIGPSLQVIIDRGELLLGTWQGIYFCEFDGPRTRYVHLKVIPG